MDPAPDITIIMPSYNVAKTIVRAVESVFNQTFGDFELLIINDASTDNTLTVAQAHLNQTSDPRARIITLPKNQGLSGARNAGLDAARGTYVTFLDADDEYLPAFLATLHSKMSEQVDIAMCGHIVVKADGSEEPRHSRFVGAVNGEHAMRAAMLDRILPFTWDKLYRRTIFDGIRYPLGSTRFEDMTVNVILYPRARTVVSIAEPLHRYYISNESLTWGRIPTEADTELALRDLHRLLPESFRTGKNSPYYASMRLLITMIVAQSAIMKIANNPTAQTTIDECRTSLTVRRIATAALRNPVLAGGAALLKFAPKTFSKIYLRHSTGRYALGD